MFVPLTLAPKGKKVRVFDCIFSFGNSRFGRAEHSIQVLTRKTDGISTLECSTSDKGVSNARFLLRIQ
jgi:hypothetical protein